MFVGPRYVSPERITIQQKSTLSIQSSTDGIAYEIAIPTHPTDPSFESHIDKKELMDEMQNLTPDKFPGPDGVTNRMLKFAGRTQFQYNRARSHCHLMGTPNTTISVANITNAANLQRR